MALVRIWNRTNWENKTAPPQTRADRTSEDLSFVASKHNEHIRANLEEFQICEDADRKLNDRSFWDRPPLILCRLIKKLVGKVNHFFDIVRAREDRFLGDHFDRIDWNVRGRMNPPQLILEVPYGMLPIAFNPKPVGKFLACDF